MNVEYRKRSVIQLHGAGRFIDELRGLATDSSDRLYLAGDAHVTVLQALHAGTTTAAAGTGRAAATAGPGVAAAATSANAPTADAIVVATWPTGAPAHSIALGPDGAIYVGEEGQIEIFEPVNLSDQKLRATWRDAERLGAVTTVAATASDVYAADLPGRCIRRLDLRGNWRSDIGKDNKMRGFLVPNQHVAFAITTLPSAAEGRTSNEPATQIFAPNPGMHRVQRFDPDGRLLGEWGRFDGRDPEGFPGCCNPTNIALLPAGDLVVTEKAGPRVKVYSPAGKLRAAWGEQDFDPNCKNMAVTTDSRAWIYVVDTERLHVVVYEPVTKSE